MDDPLDEKLYHGVSGSINEEMVYIFPHNGLIYKHDTTPVFMNLEKSARGTSVESTFKEFSRRKDRRGSFLDLISNHAGETKYRAILKNQMNLLRNIKCNG